MSDVVLYDHARWVPVALDQGPVSVCVSRVPPRADKLRGRLVLLHGNPASMHDFGRLATLLAQDFDVVAIDLPGFGRSGNVRPAAHESVLDTYARHVLAAVERLGLDGDAYLLGHSHGAAVAQTIAAHAPQRFRGLVLLASVGTPAPWCYRQLVAPGVPNALAVLAKTLHVTIPRALRWRIVQAVMTPIFSPHPLAHSWIDEQLAVVETRPEILVNMALVASGDPCDQLARSAQQVRTPTLFIHGLADRLVRPVYARAIYDIVSRHVPAEFYELPQTGHMLHLSHPERVAALIVDWVARLGQQRRALAD